MMSNEDTLKQVNNQTDQSLVVPEGRKKLKKNVTEKLTNSSIVSNSDQKSNRATPKKAETKCDSSSDASCLNSAHSSVRTLKKSVNWRDYFNPKELKQIEKIEEEPSEDSELDSDAASDSQASCDNFLQQEIDEFFVSALQSPHETLPMRFEEICEVLTSEVGHGNIDVNLRSVNKKANDLQVE